VGSVEVRDCCGPQWGQWKSGTAVAHSGDSGDARPRALPTLHVLSSQVVLVLEVQDQADSVVRSLGGQGLLWPTVGTVEGQGLLSNFKIAPYTKVVTAISARVE
jgi:hypothetical protein